jgi:hypothetical protein
MGRASHTVCPFLLTLGAFAVVDSSAQVSALAASLAGDHGSAAWGLAITYVPQLLGPTFDPATLRSALIQSAAPVARADLAYGQYQLPLTVDLEITVRPHQISRAWQAG